MVSLNIEALAPQTKVSLLINALQVLLAIITLGLGAGAHSSESRASTYTIIVCLFSIGTSVLLAWRSASPPGSRFLVALLVMWHFILMVLWAAVVGVVWSAYHDRVAGLDAQSVLLATGAFSIFNFLLWFGTAFMGCVGFHRGGMVGTRKYADAGGW